MVLLDLRACHSHLVAVTLEVQPQDQELRLALPGWTPGSYLIRDYVRQLEGLEVLQDQDHLHPRRTGTASWSVSLPRLSPVRIRYRVLATELTVRTCHLTPEHGFLALAAVVLQVQGQRWLPHRLHLQLPPDWLPFVPLPPCADGGWRARDFDQLVDTPVEAGPQSGHGFEVAAVPHRWVSWGTTLAGGDPAVDDPDWLKDVQRLCLACCRLMGVERPAADHYLFVLHLTDNGYGGLEHDHSTVLQYGRRRLAKPDGRRKLLQLVAHEYLHQWNVRRLRPAELTPYDYDRPVVVPSLWFAEGVTSYVDQLLPHAAGLSTQEEVLSDLGADLSRYLLTPGRRLQSLRQSSEEAWVKLYKADAYAVDNQISYYLKGAVLALVLDLHLRRHGSALPAVLHALWHSHGARGRGYGESDLLHAFAASAPDLATLLPAWLDGLEDPPLDAYLADVGLRLRAESAAEPWTGWQLETTAQGLTTQRVLRDSPAERAGLMVGDELIALAGQRLRAADDVSALLSSHAPGTPLPLVAARDGGLISGSLTPESPRPKGWRLELDPAAAAEAGERRRQWLALERP
ncbi:M61 family metallopeptidase [Cyanobium sp. CH-040]|nr:M61 family metallopeptidase [Cyanobium sp. CH-040]